MKTKLIDGHMHISQWLRKDGVLRFCHNFAIIH